MTDKKAKSVSPTAALIIYRDALREIATPTKEAATDDDAREWARHILDSYRIK